MSNNVYAQGMVVYDKNAPKKSYSRQTSQHHKLNNRQPQKVDSTPQRKMATFSDLLKLFLAREPSLPQQVVTTKPVEETITAPPITKKPDVPMLTGKTGTAFLIARDNVWMTARHVVEGCNRMYMMPNDAFKRTKTAQYPYQIPVKLVAMDEESDTAMVITPKGAFGAHTRPLKLSQLKTRWKGESAKAVGYPSGERGALKIKFEENRETLVTGQGNAQLDNWEIKKRDTVSEEDGGISGGPVLNRHGKVIGVLSAGHGKSEKSLGGASTVSLDKVRHFIKKTLSNKPAAFQQEKDFTYQRRNVQPSSHSGQVMKLYCLMNQ